MITKNKVNNILNIRPIPSNGRGTVNTLKILQEIRYGTSA